MNRFTDNWVAVFFMSLAAVAFMFLFAVSNQLERSEQELADTKIKLESANIQLDVANKGVKYYSEQYFETLSQLQELQEGAGQ